MSSVGPRYGEDDSCFRHAVGEVGRRLAIDVVTMGCKRERHVQLGSQVPSRSCGLGGEMSVDQLRPELAEQQAELARIVMRYFKQASSCYYLVTQHIAWQAKGQN